MDLKGAYNGATTYSVGDAVKYTDGVAYVLRKPCSAGVPPTNTLYWERVPQPLQEAIDLVLDYGTHVEGEIPALANNLTTTASGKALDARQGKALKTLIDSVAGDLSDLSPDAKTIVLTSSTEDSTKVFKITVDDDGELTATEIVSGGGT